MPAPTLALMIRPVNPANALAQKYLRRLIYPRVPRRTRPGKYAVIKSVGLGFCLIGLGGVLIGLSLMFHSVCGLDMA